jgi:hypothetical protein
LHALPDRFVVGSPHFVLLVAADFEASSVDLDTLSQRILDAGCVYFCAWGNGCERVHDCVDETIVVRELAGYPPSNIMTTWHSADSLEEAVEFAVVSAEPDDQYVAGCGAVVLATVGNAEWAEQVQRSASQHVI